jgi:hypothetical protein
VIGIRRSEMGVGLFAVQSGFVESVSPTGQIYEKDAGVWPNSGVGRAIAYVG